MKEKGMKEKYIDILRNKITPYLEKGNYLYFESPFHITIYLKDVDELLEKNQQNLKFELYLGINKSEYNLNSYITNIGELNVLKNKEVVKLYELYAKIISNRALMGLIRLIMMEAFKTIYKNKTKYEFRRVYQI